MPHIEVLSSVSPTARSTSSTSTGKTTPADGDDDAPVSFDTLLGIGLSAGDSPGGDKTDKPSIDPSPELSELAAASVAATSQQPATQIQDAEVAAGVSEFVNAAAKRKASQTNLLKNAHGIAKLNEELQDLDSLAQRKNPDRSGGIESVLQKSAGATQSTQERPLSVVAPAGVESTTPTPVQLSLTQGLEMLTRASQSPATTPATTLDIPERFGTGAWTDSFAQKVIVIAGRNEQIAEIRLNPPHLGPIEVSISMAGEEQRNTTLHFSSHQASVREAIENALPKLREMFEEAGIALGNATVGSEASANREEDSHRAGEASDTAQNVDVSTDAEQRTLARSLPLGGVDTFA